MKKNNMFKQSLLELKKTKCLAITAMLIALYIIVYVFFSVRITDFLEIRFQGVFLALVGHLFGPVVGAIAGGVGDLLKLTLKSTGGIIIGLTLSEILRGILYGICFYKSKITFKRVFIAVTIGTLFINMVLNTYWLSSYLGSDFFAFFSARAIKELILWPIQICIYYVVLKAFSKNKVLNKIFL